MDFPTALLRELLHLSSTVDLDDDEITESLRDLVTALHTAIPSYRGVCLTVVDNGSAVRLTDFLVPQDGEAVATSLRLPFAALGPGFSTVSKVVFYAATPGAFVDLAADLGHALGVPTAGRGHPSEDGHHIDGDDGQQHQRQIVLDADLPPFTLVSGLTGLEHVSVINRAVGILVDQGHHPREAHAELRRQATAAGVETPIYAARLLKR